MVACPAALLLVLATAAAAPPDGRPRRSRWLPACGSSRGLRARRPAGREHRAVLRPGGLVVVDTGRHAAHADAVLALARAAGAPIAAVVNTHWHLDHVGGNPRLRAAYPALRVHASRAIEGARTGFLAAYRRQLVDLIAGATDPAARKAWETELALVDAGPALGRTSRSWRPVADARREAVPARARGARRHRGRRLGPRPCSGVLAAGDLVTLPVPFLDTACASGWQAALATLSAAQFRVLVPATGRR